MLNTIRQVGLVIGTAAVGALLQDRLVSAMAGQAATRSAALPSRVRGQFVVGIDNSAKNGIQVEPGDPSGGAHLGPGLPAQITAEIARISHEVFTFAYVTAMRQTMVLPIILLGVGALSCLAIKRGKRAPRARPGRQDRNRRARLTVRFRSAWTGGSLCSLIFGQLHRSPKTYPWAPGKAIMRKRAHCCWEHRCEMGVPWPGRSPRVWMWHTMIRRSTH